MDLRLCEAPSSPAPGHFQELGENFGEAEVSVPQASLALSPLQTPSADLFHYDSMNAVNWGMRGECSLLGTCRDCAQLWPDPQQTMAPRWLCPNPSSHCLSLPIHSLPPLPSSSQVPGLGWSPSYPSHLGPQGHR